MAKACSIIYYTDNSLEPKLASYCRSKLLEASEGKPIISVSQQPLDFGHNICLGDIGRSHLSLYRQMLAGGEAAETELVALAEHDCLYHFDHFNYQPPDLDAFWYNVNHWYLDLARGEYSYQRRRVLSMLICERSLFLKAVREKVWMLEQGFMIRKGQAGAMEPGCVPDEKAFVRITCEPGVCDRRSDYLDSLSQFKDLGKEIGRYNAKAFRTKYPNIDIRHGRNFSGNRRGRSVCREIPYWGRFEWQ